MEEPQSDPPGVVESIQASDCAARKSASTSNDGSETMQQESSHLMRRRGIHALPFDIMESIIRFACGPCDDGTLTRWYLPLVNRHFRDVTCQMPYLWTFIDSHRNPRPSLERSKPLYLSISARNASAPYVRFNDFLDAIKPHTERWKSFTLKSKAEQGGTTMNNPRSRVHRRMCYLRDSFRGSTFPALETLRVDYGSDLAVFELDKNWWGVANAPDPTLNPYFSVRNFFSTWNMPALRSVEISGFFPSLPESCRANITSLWIRIDIERRYDPYVSLCIHDLVDLLEGLPALEELSLATSHLYEWYKGRTDHREVELKRLKDLSFWLNDYLDNSHFDQVPEAFSAPNLEELIVDVDKVDLAWAVMRHLFRDDGTPRFRMEYLTLNLKRDGWDGDPRNRTYDALHMLFQGLPDVRHLSISYWSHRWPDVFRLHEYFEQDKDSHTPPPLRTVRFKHCKNLSTHFILNHLVDVINSPDFETLEIHHCPNVDIDAVRNVIPEGKKFNYTVSASLE